MYTIVWASLSSAEIPNDGGLSVGIDDWMNKTIAQKIAGN
jgi:hypothetical protein